MKSENTGRWDWLYLLLRILLGVIFIYAGCIKLFDSGAFAQAVYNYKILPLFMVNPVAVILPWIEVICGVFLIAGFLTRGSALIIDCLLLIFVFALSFNLYRGLDISCGCFNLSSVGEKIILFTLARDISLLIPGIWILIYKHRRWVIGNHWK
jgi:Methylamine utilisation protein MauE.